MRLLAFDTGVSGASVSALAGLQILDAAGVLGGTSGIGEQLGIVGLLAVATALLLVRREVNRVLQAVEMIHDHESRISALEAAYHVERRLVDRHANEGV